MTNIRPTIAFVGLLAAIAIVLAVHPATPVEPAPNLALFHQSESISLPEGTLIRTEGDERVYYVENGEKRWIDSAGTLQAQGLAAQGIRTISAAEMAFYPDGEPITQVTRLVLPHEQKVLPDLAPLAPYELRLSTVGGRAVIRFTGSFWNKGYRPFQLVSENQLAAGGGGSEDVFQQVQAEDGTIRKKFIGTFTFHPAHHHHHFDDFAEYLFEPAQFIPGTKTLAPSVRQKTTFCMRDDERMPADIPNVPVGRVFSTCNTQGQGVSPGWIDVYANTLPDQYVDVQDMPPGVYALSFALDPQKRFIEARSDNDIATTLVELNVQRGLLRVIGAMAPFPTLRNHIDDGTLIRDAGTGNVYVIDRGRKRWLRSVDIFASYGYDWNSVYPATKAMVEAIPSQQLIRRLRTQEVYVVNERGYYRHILNPAVFASYGFAAADIADINEFDFASYAKTDLIMRPGDEQVYMISGTTKSPLGALSMLQGNSYDLRGLELVNETDFAAYLTVVR